MGGAAGGRAQLGPCPLPGGHRPPASPLQDSSAPGRKKGGVKIKFWWRHAVLFIFIFTALSDIQR